MKDNTRGLRNFRGGPEIEDFIRKYPLSADLERRTKRRIPRFAFEYLAGGNTDEVNLRANREGLEKITLEPRYLGDFREADMRTVLFGEEYAAPFGIAPLGLQGLIWPNAPVILARTAVKHRLPFVLSTVSTSSIEEIATITEGRFWYQLYHPVRDDLRDDLLDRARSAGVRVLVVTADVPSHGYRPREFRSGLAMPPQMTLDNFLQIAGRPLWALSTLRHGQPRFATVQKYLDGKTRVRKLGQFMKENFAGRITTDRLKALRDKWDGPLVVKGLASAGDLETCLAIGVDGVVLSNHGGRQLDAGEAAIQTLMRLAPEYAGRITLMMDGGVRSGPDIARTLACGAAFTFLGRTFMYGVGALGVQGGDHTAAMLKLQLRQVMEQLGCEQTGNLRDHRRS